MAPPSSSGGSNASNVQWSEKYRPINFKDFVGNKDAISQIEAIANYDPYEDEDMPNLILSGPSGTGKTSSVYALMHKIFGLGFDDYVLDLDASEDRDMDDMIQEIRMFGQKKLRIGYGFYRMVILDNADSMTYRAQKVLSRVMEVYSHSTRFTLISNTTSDVVDLIDSIQNQCTHVLFSRLPDEVILNRLLKVIREEEVRYVPDAFEAIIACANGDMRQALNILQAAHLGFPSLSRENVHEASRKLQFQQVESMTSDDDVIESNAEDDACLAFENILSGKKREGDQCESSRDNKRICQDNSCLSEARRFLCSILPREHRAEVLEVIDGVDCCFETLNERVTKLAVENKELEGMMRDWKVRFADVEIKRKEAKKRLKMVEEEKAELLRKVAELEKAQAGRVVEFEHLNIRFIYNSVEQMKSNSNRIF